MTGEFVERSRAGMAHLIVRESMIQLCTALKCDRNAAVFRD